MAFKINSSYCKMCGFFNEYVASSDEIKFDEMKENKFEQYLDKIVKNWSIEKCEKILKMINTEKRIKMEKVAEYKIFLEAEAGNIAEVKQLLEFVDVDSKDYDDNSIMHFAAKSGRVELVTCLLIEYEAEMNCRNRDLDTPLHIAARYGYTGIVEIFLDEGIYIDVKNIFKNTPLHEASSNGHINVVKMLIDRNSKLDIKNDDEKTPYNCAKHEDVILEFMKANVFNNTCIENLLFDAIENNWKKIFYKLILTKISTNSILVNNNDLESPLIYAVRYGRTGMLETLILHGMDISYKNKYNNAAIHLAASIAHDKCIKMLIKHKANVNEIGFEERTPLLCAVWEGGLTTIEILLNHGANICNVDKDLWNALHYAIDKGHANVVEFLLDKGADLEGCDVDGRTPLYHASWKGYANIVQILIDRGADINTKDNTLSSPLHVACDNNNLMIVELLLKHGADKNVFNNMNKLPLNIAKDKQYIEVIGLLKKHS